MSTDAIHERARQLVLDQNIDDLTPDDARWLQEHLGACETCARYADVTEAAISTLRLTSETPSPTLVRLTKRSVRMATGHIGDAESRRRMLIVSCSLAGAWGLLLQPYIWRLFAWAGDYVGLPDPAWQAVFVMMWLLPGIVATLVLTHVELPGWARLGARKGRNV